MLNMSFWFLSTTIVLDFKIILHICIEQKKTKSFFKANEILQALDVDPFQNDLAHWC